ncbi:MAG: transglutaminase-like domain-containing protein [Arcobacteraceae bacterium]
MKRRTFLKTTAFLGTSALVVPSIIFAKTNNSFGIDTTPRKFSITNTYSLETTKEEAQLWVPLPLEEEYQKVIKISYEGDFNEAYISNENPFNTKILYAKWNKNSKKRELTVNLDIITQTRSVNFSKANNSLDFNNKVKEYLKGTTHTPVNDTVKAFVKDIVKNEKTQLQKAQAIYDWTVLNMYRDESVKGCGVGDAMKTIQDKIFGGKCTDISSVFVALLRNANIPAREVFGIRVGQSKISNACGKANEKGFANITGGQHCRAEFYIGGIGWVPADPADVTKVRLAENLKNEDKKVKDTKAYMFGNWEMNWMAFNYARDFILSPKPTQYPLNMLGYPYAEIGEDAQDYYDAKTFSYEYISQERV